MNNSTPANTTVPPEVMLAGGISASARLLDGTAESVLVKLCTIRMVPKFLALMDKEAELLEFICAKPEGWADKLTPESSEELLEKALELNRPIIAGFVNRQAKLAKFGVGALAPLAEQMKAMTSQLSSQTAPSPSASP